MTERANIFPMLYQGIQGEPTHGQGLDTRAASQVDSTGITVRGGEGEGATLAWLLGTVAFGGVVGGTTWYLTDKNWKKKCDNFDPNCKQPTKDNCKPLCPQCPESGSGGKDPVTDPCEKQYKNNEPLTYECLVQGLNADDPKFKIVDATPGKENSELKPCKRQLIRREFPIPQGTLAYDADWVLPKCYKEDDDGNTPKPAVLYTADDTTLELDDDNAASFMNPGCATSDSNFVKTLLDTFEDDGDLAINSDAINACVHAAYSEVEGTGMSTYNLNNRCQAALIQYFGSGDANKATSAANVKSACEKALLVPFHFAYDESDIANAANTANDAKNDDEPFTIPFNTEEICEYIEEFPGCPGYPAPDDGQ